MIYSRRISRVRTCWLAAMSSAGGQEMGQEQSCQECTKSFAPALVSPCTSCSRSICFNCQSMQQGMFVFCGMCVRKCSGCGDKLMPFDPHNAFEPPKEPLAYCCSCGRPGDFCAKCEGSNKILKKCLKSDCGSYICWPCRDTTPLVHALGIGPYFVCARHQKACSFCHRNCLVDDLHRCGESDCDKSYCKSTRARITGDFVSGCAGDPFAPMMRDMRSNTLVCREHLIYCISCAQLTRSLRPADVADLHPEAREEGSRRCRVCVSRCLEAVDLMAATVWEARGLDLPVEVTWVILKHLMVQSQWPLPNGL